MIAMRGVAVALLAGSVVLVGCRPKQNPTMEPTIERGEAMPRPMTAENRAEELGEAVDEFAGARNGLVGHSDEQSRKQLAEAIGELSDVLTLLKGSDPNGAFRQQIRIMERARTRLSGDLATAPEPTINAALRAAQRALADMASSQFANDEQTNSLMQALDSRIEVLHTERGPLHAFEAARALDALGAVVERMAELVRQRLPQPQEAPATAPAAEAQSPALYARVLPAALRRSYDVSR
ncbi:MAG TPA: hypothetical protein VGR35_05995 [Tepidisphaeraceae bacterium]|nr:hypothetical protein [Tepidisphaeraceae bacterium]